MAEKSNQKLSTIWSNKPVKMKLFGAWEIDKTPPHCIPRLCSLYINRLSVTQTFSHDSSPIFIAVRMQNSKRILRSNEIQIVLPTPTVIGSHNSTTANSDSAAEQSGTGTPDLFDIELDLLFTLQYPHFLKRNCNYLQVFLQRRKRLKNTALLGFKTLASGFIDMAEVLQKTNIAERTIDLIKVSDEEEIIAQLSILSLKSQPIDTENAAGTGNNQRKGKFFDHRLDIYSDEDEFTSGEDASDSETVEDSNSMAQFKRRKDRKQRKAGNARVQNVQQQRNFKQKLFNLIKKFRMPDSEAYDTEEKFQAALEKELMAPGQPDELIDEFFDDEELEDPDDLSDSGQEIDDNISISSTPKPSLRPYFSSCTLVDQEIREEDSPENSGADTSDTSQKCIEDIKKKKPVQVIQQEVVKQEPPPKAEVTVTKQKSKLFQKSDKENRSKETTPKEKERKPVATVLSFTSSSPFVKDDNSPKEYVSEQLNRMFSGCDEHFIPEEIIFINLAECLHGPSLVQAFERTNHIIATNTISDVRYAFNYLCGRIQRYCNSNVKSIQPIKIALIGSDAYVNVFLRNYVETFSSKSPEWQTYLRFYLVPSVYISNSSSLLHTYLSSIDAGYAGHFAKSVPHDFPFGSCGQELNSGSSNISSSPLSVISSTGNVSSNVSSQDAHFVHDLVTKCLTFMRSAQTILQIPIAEAMITYKDKTGQDECNQSFIPFICDAKLGLLENVYRNHSQEMDDLPNSPPSQFSVAALSERLSNEKSSSGNPNLPPGSSGGANVNTSGGQESGANSVTRGNSIVNQGTTTNQTGVNVSPLTNREQSIVSGSLTPPNSPSISSANHSFSSSATKEHKESYGSEPIDLQIDYWCVQPKITIDSAQGFGNVNSFKEGSGGTSGGKNKPESSKITIKNSFKNLQIFRLPALGEASISSLTLVYMLKEKKQKIMRLGKKKEKENEQKCQTVHGIFRMICSNKTTQSPIKVSLDGVELSNVKYFQITNQWQTQVKSFPLAIFRNINNNLSQQ